MKTQTKLFVVAALAALSFGAEARIQDPTMPMTDHAMMSMSTGTFKGAEIHGGMATLMDRTLKLSPDFKIPKAPAPSWQIVDKDGNVFLLKQLNIVGGKTNRQIMLPSYIKSVAKVQIWCSFAEVLLGEAAFAHPIDLK